MKCDFCGRDKFVKENEIFGEICYFCLKERVSLLNIYLEQWFESEIREQIQREVVSFSRINGGFDLDKFMNYYNFEEDIIIDSLLNALREGGLPEFIRESLMDELKRKDVLE